MRFPGLAIAWQLWCRHRLGLCAVVAGWLVLAALCWSPLLRGAAPADVLSWASVPAIAALVYLLAVFSWSFNADLGSGASAFPRSLFLLPVPATRLAGWPLLTGSIAMVMLWLACALGVLWPLGAKVPLVWPALLLAAFLAWLQAITWYPFPSAWPRGPVAIAVLAGLAISPLLVHALLAPEWVITVEMTLAIPAAYGVALAGVRRARCGEVGSWAWLPRLHWPTKRQKSTPFASAARAQDWFEWARLRRPAMMLVMGCVLFMPVVLFVPKDEGIGQLAGTGAFPVFTTLVHTFTPTGVVLVFLLLYPLFMSLTLGAEIGKADAEGKALPLTSFVATRPIRTGDLVLAKFRLAARGALAMWAPYLLLVAVCLAFGGRYARLAASPWAAEAGPDRAWAQAIVLVGALVLQSWLLLVKGLWVGLAGRTWLQLTAIALGLAFITGAGALTAWLRNSPEPLSATLAALPYLAGALVACKFAVAAWLLAVVRRRGLWSDRELGALALVWFVLVAAMAGGLAFLFPADVLSRGWVILLAVLSVPLGRMLLAPLALDWNRHR